MNGTAKHATDKTRRRWYIGEILGLLVVILGCAWLGLLSLRQWLDLHRSERFLSASLLAKSTADYSRNQPGTQVAQVNLGIN